MANSKELTEQVMELHKKQTEEQAWKLTEIVFANSTKKGIF